MGRVVIPGFRKIETSSSGEGGTTNYNDLSNKPSINNVPLVGNLRTANLKLTDATLTEEGVPAESKTVGAKLAEQSTSLTALSEQLGNHTVKSDVPENAVFTDTVYDDTEVKESITELNSNLDTLEFSDVAGGKNIIGCTNVIESSYGTLTKTESGYSVTGVYYGILEFKCEKNTDYFIGYEKSGSGTNLVKAINSSRNADIAAFNTNGGTFNSGDNETVYLYLYGGYGTSNTSIYNNFLLCKGTSGTYEPYIPSVKMLAEEVNAQNSNLHEFGIVNLYSGDLYNGYIDNDTGDVAPYVRTICTQNILPCEPDKNFVLDFETDIGTCELKIVFYNGNTKLSVNVFDTSEHIATAKAPSNANGYRFQITRTEESASFPISEVKNVICYQGYLAKELGNINESLSDYGLVDVFDGVWTQGYFDEGNETFNTSDNYVHSNYYKCVGNKPVTFHYTESGVSLIAYFFTDSGYIGRVFGKSTADGFVFNAPSNATRYVICVNRTGITPSNAQNARLYINNAIDSLKNDLDKLNSLPIGSIIQIEAAKDNIETTTQKYGWQYLGTSNIECNDGSVKLLVTNVYRKNN